MDDEQHNKLLKLVYLYKVITILAYLYFMLVELRTTNRMIILALAIVLVLVKAWYLDRRFLKASGFVFDITKPAFIFLIIADVNLIMIIPAIFDLLKDVLVANLVRDPSAKQHSGTYGIMADHSVGLFSACVMLIYIIEQQCMKYINFKES